ncbi:MAG: hypothetical protein E7A42_12670 [Leclercia adecarboxylata]|nr:hypothetical protein [Leclercia adecarboxylata]
MMKLNPRINHDLTMHFAELYHKGSTYIPTFKLLQWFNKDGGRLTPAFFKREIFARWVEYMEFDNADALEECSLGVISVLSDHSVKKPEGYTIFQQEYVFIEPNSSATEDEDEDD